MALPPRLPRRFPVGTRFVVEGEPDGEGAVRIMSRYLVLPNGRRYDLMPPPGPARRTRRGSGPAAARRA